VTNGARAIAAGLALTLAAGIGLLVLRRLDRTSPLPVHEAVDRFRGTPTVPPIAAGSTTPTASANGARPTATGAATGPGATAAPGATATTVPGGKPSAATDRRTPEGVYVYETTGYETADLGPTHSRHDYPKETTLTVRHDACGQRARWDATKERWDDIAQCLDPDATRVTAYTSYHSFYGNADRHDYTCSGTSYLRPPSTRAGYRWSFDCTTGQADAHTDARVVGTETVRGARALRVHYDTTLTGGSRGTNPQDIWLALDGPYVLRETWLVDAAVDTAFGTVRYHEQYELLLHSRSPLR
jgi:hypothetical protein